ncbi:class II aldolase/adducin family protein [Nocardioides marmoribigeumensis]|uniref:L-fuculose-phosphate aldolase n=1 Tax=Nocardioides marmoribigeumensis TaxID=433649 RepID=A0ABU2BZC3_9ACTN|nr:class II aldolase/adducin family protein [Nocardioides marmoribigeumensis]MDR7363756.1 L-fuculose-phosphate aldolase [Nocardioides marmoribigeumensis]
MTQAPWASARAEVVATCRRAAAQGLVVGTAGNVSLGVGDHVAITATGADFATLEEQHVVLVDRSGRLVEGDLEPTSELELHLGIHRAHDEPVAVVHTHAPVGVAVSTVTDTLPVLHYQQLLLGGEVRVAPFAPFGSPELAAHVHAALEGRQAALMANHGSVAWGPSLATALDHAVLLEWLCTVHRDACLMGTPRPLTEAEQTAVVEAALTRSYGSTRAAGSTSTTST